MGVAAEIRHKQILEQLGSKGRIYVKDISQALEVTEVTVRRDLTFLEENGLVKKTYGGAVLTAPEVNVSVRYRQKRRLSAKRIVGKLASELIKDGDIIYLEAGSTCYEIIPYLIPFEIDNLLPSHPGIDRSCDNIPRMLIDASLEKLVYFIFCQVAHPSVVLLKSERLAPVKGIALY